MSKLISIFAGLIALSGCSFIQSENPYTNSQIVTWPDDKRGAISITYDDATINQFRQAMPIMDSLGFKGTFFINTADIPGSKYPPKYFGRPLDVIVSESTTPTNNDNLFERCSALRFLNIEGAVEAHNRAGSLYENEKYQDAFNVVNEAFAVARRKRSIKETRPVLLTGEVITWPEIRKFAASGHEFGNHTISHPRLAVLDEANLLYEMEKCRDEILFQVGPDHTFSAECPFGTEDERVMKYALKIHPALRNRMPEPFLEELNRWNPAAPGSSDKPYIQWQRGPLQKTTIEEMKSYVDTLLVHNNIWLVLTFHGVDGVGWEAKPHGELRTYFTYMKKRADSLWVAPFGQVTKYIREKMHTRVKITSKGDGVSITLTHSLGADYNVPLTLKTYIRVSDDIAVKQGNTDVPFKTDADQTGTYILYNVLPNKGETTITAK